jgi:NTE family protein
MPSSDATGDKVGLVLAGGGARGAYEAGVLDELLPAIEEEYGPEQFPKVVVGTSVGALQAAFFGANAHRGAAHVMDAAIELWETIEPGDVIRSLSKGLPRAFSYVTSLLGLHEETILQTLDPGPLWETLAGKPTKQGKSAKIDFAQLHRNVGKHLDAVAVVATAAGTSRSVVFYEGARRKPRKDNRRAIDYFPTSLHLQHVMASSAIPIAFPAVEISKSRRPAETRWYFDGGTRLNTPIKPALRLGADRVIVIALNSVPQRDEVTRPVRGQPDASEGALQLVQAVLVDPLVQDVRTLARRNEAGQDKVVPYILIAPEPYAVGALAEEAYRRFKRRPFDEIAILGRLTGKSGEAPHGEILSYLFFACEFTKVLVQLGREDARRWLRRHRRGPEPYWRVSPP